MEENMLKYKEVFPNEEVLEFTLGKSYIAYRELISRLSEKNITTQWNYYNDGKSWLCKLLLKKRNLAWLSVYDKSFNVTCYFMEKHIEDIDNSHISQPIKEQFYNAKPIGKLIPMTIKTSQDIISNDVVEMILLKITH